MIRKLRIKLVLASMLSLLLVLVIIFSIVGVLNYVQVTQNADEILTLLALNDGHFGAMTIGRARQSRRKICTSRAIAFPQKFRMKQDIFRCFSSRMEV